jgi:hypothetical protein
VWAFADFPLAAYIAIFLPLDLLFVGPEIVSTDRLPGSFAMVWAALSVAVAMSAMAWTVFLLLRGTQVASGLRGRPLFVMLLLGCGLALLLYLVFIVKELF